VVEPAALQDFLAVLTADRSPARSSTPPADDPAPARTQAARREAVELAGRRLDEIGL
jgi:hypothetical protein